MKSIVQFEEVWKAIGRPITNDDWNNLVSDMEKYGGKDGHYFVMLNKEQTKLLWLYHVPDSYINSPILFVSYNDIKKHLDSRRN